mgnify:CR=1 FL=1
MDHAQRAVQTALDGFGGLDIIVQNAGIYPWTLIENTSPEEWDKVLAVNLKGTFLAARAALPHMKQKKSGRMIFTSSITGPRVTSPGHGHYSASKAGVVGMTLPIARDLAGEAIRVNTILPGIFDTPLLAGAPQNVRDALGASVPYPKRLGQPEEYAKLAMCMIETSYFNGEDVRLDGAIRMAPR